MKEELDIYRVDKGYRVDRDSPLKAKYGIYIEFFERGQKIE